MTGIAILITAAAAAVVLAAAVMYGVGRHAERRRWAVLHTAAVLSAERGEPILDMDTPPGDVRDLERLSRRLSEVVRRLTRHWMSTQGEMTSMRRSLDGLDVGVVLLDPLGRVLLANQPAREVWGALTPKVMGKYRIDVFDTPAIDEALSDVRRDSRERVLEHVVENPRRVYEVRVRPLAADNGEDRPFVLVELRDVSEIRAIERMRRDFVANASHELRAPLTAIQQCTDELQGRAHGHDADGEGGRETDGAERISANVELMAHILDDMLTLAKVESFETPVERVPLDLAEEAQRALDAIQPRVQRRHLHAEAHLAPARVLADTTQIQHVIGNLLNNACRFTPEEGRVVLRTDEVERDGRRWGRLVVEDTGVGVPPQDRTRIFERFYRVDDDARANGADRRGGTGLGLAIVKHIVIRHDGRVWVEERDGPGSRFVCLLPAVVAEA